jgi:hypothetical protein
MKTKRQIIGAVLISAFVVSPVFAQDYKFEGGYPTPETIQQAYDDADLTRAIEAYKFFFPSVSILGTWDGNIAAGTVPNKSFLLLHGRPEQVVFTPNSDTPYAGGNVDLSSGPVVVELPPGPLICVVNDLNQRWVMDMGLPGPDAGKGGKHIILPPGYKGEVPAGYYAGTATTDRALILFRAIPPAGDDAKAVELLKTIKVHPLDPPADWKAVEWIDQGAKPQDFSLVRWERGLDYWKKLHEIIETEPPFEAYRMEYGRLATLGIEKGKPFNPDARMKKILEQAAVTANDQMRVASFADRREDCMMWPDRKWEWATLRPENGTFDLPNYKDLDARGKWFYQAQIESPAMFRRTAAAGSLYWLGTRDNTGTYLDGSKTYKLTVPQPVPAKLFWSVTVYDPENRSEIVTDQGKAALRSLFELRDKTGEKSVDLYFGLTAPAGHEGQWIKTIPGKGWFVYFRIYGPEAPAFDGTWKPGDFEEVK